MNIMNTKRVNLLTRNIRMFSSSRKTTGLDSTITNDISIQQTLYKRPLSDNLVAFSSPEGKKLFKEALVAGYMENYFPLAE